MRHTISTLLVSLVRSGLLAGATYALLGEGGLISGASGLSFAFWSVPIYVAAALLLASDVTHIAAKGWWVPAASLLLARLGLALAALAALRGLRSLTAAMTAEEAYAKTGSALTPYLDHIAGLGLWAFVLIMAFALYRAARPWLARVAGEPIAFAERIHGAPNLRSAYVLGSLLSGAVFLVVHPDGFLNVGTGVDLGYLQVPVYLFATARVAGDAVALYGRGIWRYAVGLAVKGAATTYLVLVLVGGIGLWLEALVQANAVGQGSSLEPYLLHLQNAASWAMLFVALTALYRISAVYLERANLPGMSDSLREAPDAPVHMVLITAVGTLAVFLLLDGNGFVQLGGKLNLSFLALPLYAFFSLRALGGLAGSFVLPPWRRFLGQGLHGAAWALLAFTTFGSLPSVQEALLATPSLEEAGRALEPYFGLFFPLAYWITGYVVLVTIYSATAVFWNQPRFPWVPPRLREDDSALRRLMNRGVAAALATHVVFAPAGLVRLWFGASVPFVAPLFYLVIALLLASSLLKVVGSGRWRHGLVATLSNRQLANAVARELESAEPAALADFPEEVAELRASLNDPEKAEDAARQMDALNALVARGAGRARRAGRLLHEALSLRGRGIEEAKREEFDAAQENFSSALKGLEEARTVLGGADPGLEQDIGAAVGTLHAASASLLVGRGRAAIRRAQEAHDKGGYQDAFKGFESGAGHLQRAREYAELHGVQQETASLPELLPQAQEGMQRCVEDVRQEAQALYAQAREQAGAKEHRRAQELVERGQAALKLAEEMATRLGLQQAMEALADAGRQMDGFVKELEETARRRQVTPFAPRGVDALYEFLELLGRGGQGEVWLGRRRADGLPVALKVPLGAVGRVMASLDLSVYEAFGQEVEHWQRLKHPNIVQMFEAGDSPYPWIAMELMEGKDLRVRLRQGTMALRQALETAAPICDALAYAHMGGVFHQDLKPENVLFAKDGAPKLSDWGMAAHFHSFSGGRGFQGTLPYTAPERISGTKPDRQTDLFSLGIMLYEMVTGRYPFTEDGAIPTTSDLGFLSHIHDPAWPLPPPSRVHPYLPSRMDDVVGKLLAKDRSQRYELAEQVGRDLREVLRWL